MALDQAGHAVERHAKDLSDSEERLPGHRSALQRAEDTLRDRPALDRERHVIDRALRRDLGARSAAIAADPPDRLVDWLGPRPERSAGRWDEAAARFDQHRSAFDLTDKRSPLGSIAPPWEHAASRPASGQPQPHSTASTEASAGPVSWSARGPS